MRWLGVAVITLVAAPPAVSQPARGLDSTFAALRAGPAAPAAAIMVTHRGRVVYQNVAGFADLERRVPATMDTRFDVASLAKQFTAFGVSRLVEEGRLSTAHRVDRYLPGLDLSGAGITIEQLIHHTSGLEDADGLMVLAGWLPGDDVPFQDLVSLLLRQQHLRFAPGEQHFYSNGGYVLLAEIVARLAGTAFPAYSDSTIFKPLGMRATAFVPDPGTLIPDRALPYAREGGVLRASRTDRYPGAGGLFTTVGDLSRWAAHLIRPGNDSGATLRLREPGRLANGEAINYAWGLGAGSYRGRATLSHAGSGPATEAQLVVLPELEFSAVVLAAGPVNFNPSTLAYRAVDAFLGDELAPKDTTPPRMMMMTEEMLNREPEESKGVVVPAGRLARLAGTYRLGDNPPMVVRERRGRLEFSWGGRGTFIPLFPLPDGRFAMMPLWDVYRFTTDGDGRGTGIVRERVARSVRRNGPERIEGVRVPDPPPFDSVSAAPYVGWYYGDETGAHYRVVFENGTLVLRHNRLGAFPLNLEGGDAFWIESMLIAGARFARSGGAVVGLELEAFSWSVTSSFRRLTGPP